MNEPPDENERRAWQRRIIALTDSSEWHEEMREYTRGFPKHWETPLQVESLDMFEALSERLPAASFELDLLREDVRLEELVSHPMRARIAILRIRLGSLGGNRIAQLVELCEQEGLKAIDLSMLGLSQGSAEALVESPLMSVLRGLDLQENAIKDSGIEELAKFDGETILETLDFKNCYLSDAPLVKLITAPIASNLRKLQLYNNSYVGEAVIEALADKSCEFSLRRLGLASCNVDDDAVLALMKSRHAVSLVKLDLSYNEGVGDGAATVIARESRRLEKLHLSNTSVADRGAKALAASPHVSKLRVLGLHWCKVGAEGAVALANSDHLGALEELSLSLNNIRAKGARAFAKTTKLTSMRALSIGDNQIGASGVKAFLDSPNIAWLDHFSLPEEEVSEELYAKIKFSPHLTKAQRWSYWNPCSLKELRKMASEYKIRGRSKLDRDELIEAILEHHQSAHAK
jgi:hypothetical protein